MLITAPISVCWGDMDAFGHVNNSVFATYREEARLRWFATIRILSRETPQKFYSDGSTVLVWTDRATGRAGPLPDSVHRAAG